MVAATQVQPGRDMRYGVNAVRLQLWPGRNIYGPQDRSAPLQPGVIPFSGHPLVILWALRSRYCSAQRWWSLDLPVLMIVPIVAIIYFTYKTYLKTVKFR
jgi:hypothetical protein